LSSPLVASLKLAGLDVIKNADNIVIGRIVGDALIIRFVGADLDNGTMRLCIPRSLHRGKTEVFDTPDFGVNLYVTLVCNHVDIATHNINMLFV